MCLPAVYIRLAVKQTIRTQNTLTTQEEAKERCALCAGCKNQKNKKFLILSSQK
jgi:hypothetical protein